MDFIAKTDVGKKRSNNEDAFFTKIYNENIALFIVADGLGGYESGEVASSLLIKVFTEYFENSIQNIDASITDAKVKTILTKALLAANEKIYRLEKTDVKYRGMGTTIVLITKIYDKMYYLSIGDSRLYFLDDHLTHIRQVTEDDTYVNELLRTNAIRPEEVENHPQKHVLTKAIGIFSKVDVVVRKLNAKSGYLLLCTDGLTNMVTSSEILNIMRKYKFEELATKLVFKANLHGGNDNITVVIVKI
ncbi:MAG: Stp1/IreP family PP2C-type Ser/Thr phosphatase [Clostridia bacterium]|nr:Stp1/IreP family PP2C-type Ser/Thr phosphatase [Clostridia bacterium]